MQVKVVIGTIAFMLTMMIMGFAALREPGRLEAFSAAAEGRSIETGAEIFINNCATCHGVDGTASSCIDPATGEETGCQGLPLAIYEVLCDEQGGTRRMQAMQWAGTKEQFIYQTVSAGRIGTVMPTWSSQYGGPMRDDQIQNVVDFVLNWETEEMCANPPSPFPWDELPAVEDFLVYENAEIEVAMQPGDPVRGEEMYTQYGCVACHGDVAVADSNKVGPWLGDIGEVGATRVEGESALQYAYNSILYPDLFIAPDCPTGPCASPSAMPGTFPGRFASAPQDLADLLAYLAGTGE